ncbi:MAG: hypothetical protein FWE86_01635 [Oscillospiraceae bacterium]|nr:hypothetical protein [Oscillospiraceae bacterium]
MRNVIVTGVTGKSGRFFYDRLVREAENLGDYTFRFSVRRGGSQFDAGAGEKAGLKLETISGNLYKPEDCRELCLGGDVLLHIAGIDKSLALVKAAAEAGIKRMILVHTTGIYSKYKAAGEGYRQIESEIESLLPEGTSLTILRPTMIYGHLGDGNLEIFIKMIDKLRIFPTVTGGRYPLQPVWCKDLGDAYFDVLTRPEVTGGKDYILSGGEPILLIDMLKRIGEKLGKKNTFIPVPFWLAYGGAWALFCLTLGRIDFREKIQRMVEPRAFPHDEAARDFGYSPARFEDGIDGEINEYIESQKRR